METLNKIIKACFEGLFGTMIGGLVIFALQSMRRNRRILLVAAVLLSVMAGWRFCIPHFYSPRYAAAFLLPAILFTAFMMVKFRKWWWVLTVIFCIICCCKIFRFSPTGSLITQSSALISADAAGRGKAFIYIMTFDVKRMKFYSGMETRLLTKVNEEAQLRKYLRWILNADARNADVVYVCIDRPAGGIIAKDDFKKQPGNWELIHVFPKNRKKKVDHHIYRYQKVIK